MWLLQAAALMLVLPVRGASPGYPTDASAKKLIRSGDSELRAGKYQEAVASSVQSIDIEPSARAFMLQHKAFLKQGRRNKAWTALDKAVKLSPDGFITPLLQRAGLELLIGRCGESVTSYEGVLAVQPNKRDALKRIPEARTCRDSVKAAEASARAGRWEDAHRFYGSALERGRATESTDLMTRRAAMAFRLGKWQDVIQITAKAIKLDSTNLEAVQLRGDSFFRIGDLAMARTHFAQGLKLDPEHTALKESFRRVRRMEDSVKRGDRLAGAGDHAGAAAAYAEAEAVDPHHAAVFLAQLRPKLVRALTAAGQHDAAVQKAMQVVHASRDDPDAHLLICEALIGKEDYQQAIRACQQAEQLAARANMRNQMQQARQMRAKAETMLKRANTKDYYKVLGVAKTATSADIKRAYRKLAMQFHPDKAKGEEQQEEYKNKMQELNEANDILSDDDKRRRYDAGEDLDGSRADGAQQQQQQQQRGGPHPFHFARRGGGGQTFTFRFG